MKRETKLFYLRYYEIFIKTKKQICFRAGENKNFKVQITTYMYVVLLVVSLALDYADSGRRATTSFCI